MSKTSERIKADIKQVNPPAKEQAPMAPQVAKPKEGTPKALKIGKTVLWYKKVPQNNGIDKLIPFPGIITAIADGNFQAKDGAVNLVVFTLYGAVETRHGVTYSEKPAHGKWSELD